MVISKIQLSNPGPSWPSCLPSYLQFITGQNALNFSQMTDFRLFQTEKEFADNNFEFYENGRKFSRRAEKTVKKEKLLVWSNFSLSHSVFKRLVLPTHEAQGLFGKGLIIHIKD